MLFLFYQSRGVHEKGIFLAENKWFVSTKYLRADTHDWSACSLTQNARVEAEPLGSTAAGHILMLYLTIWTQNMLDKVYSCCSVSS